MIRVGLIIIMLLSFTGCKDAKPQSALKTIDIKLGNKTFTLEIADTEAAREYGLMKRDSMPDDHGMIFVFRGREFNPFWMKNTRIPLDILYIDADAKVIVVKQMKPYDLTPTPSPRPYRWAIELNKGAAEAAGVKAGDQLAIPPEAQTAPE